MKRRVFSEDGLEREFAENGFVAVPMLSPEQVGSLLGALSRLAPADGWMPDGSGPAQNSYHCSFLDDDKAYKRAAFDLLSQAFAEVIDRHLQDFRPLSANFYVKPAGRGKIPVHQNWPVLDSLEATSVTVWCPLVDVDAANGGLHVVPKSHKLVPHVEGPGALSYFSSFRDDLDDLLLPLSAKAGDGFIFDDSLIHGSPDNGGKSSRIAVQITCVPKESAPVFYFPRDHSSFELIEADSDFYIENSIVDLVERGKDWDPGRMVANANRQIDKDQFRAMLSPAPAPQRSAGTRRGWLQRAFGWIAGS